MTGATTVRVSDADAGQRLDRWLKTHADVGHVQVQKLVRTGQVRVDGRRAKAGQRLEAGQEVRLPPGLGDGPERGQGTAAKRKPKAKPVSARDAEDLKARILHMDRDVIVLDKPAGLAVQGGTGTERHLDAMLDALRFEAEERPRLVHRLDRDTSGVLVLARHRKAAAFLTRAFGQREARKVYWAAVIGRPRPDEGVVKTALAKAGGRGKEKMVASEDDDAKPATTRYRMQDHAGRRLSWLVMEPLTGRTHQLRAHAAHLGTPILGDGKYGGAAARLEGEGVAEGALENRLHLHARAIRMPHPAGGWLEAKAPLPGHMRKTWDFFGFDDRNVPDPFESGHNRG